MYFPTSPSLESYRNLQTLASDYAEDARPRRAQQWQEQFACALENWVKKGELYSALLTVDVALTWRLFGLGLGRNVWISNFVGSNGSRLFPGARSKGI